MTVGVLPLSLEKPLRDLQKRLLLSMVNLNSSNESPEHAWKILILDSASQSVISPVIKVNELRDNGVTLYIDRQPIADVPAVYFVEPNVENISRICQDLKSRLYETIYLNFTSSIPRNLLEDLAHHAVQTEQATVISKIFDQYLNYHCLESNLFTLDLLDVYSLLNNSKSTDSAIESTLEMVASGLFSVLLTFGGQPPIICSNRGTSAELVASKLDTKIRNHLINIRSNYLGNVDSLDESSLQRSSNSCHDFFLVVLILDRNFDLIAPLKHASTYNSLVHDVLGMKLNRLAVSIKIDGGTKKSAYSIDSEDAFWKANSSLPFPTVADNVDAALNKWKLDSQMVTRSTGIENLQNIDNEVGQNALSAEQLKMAVNVVPELTARKQIIDMHIFISTGLLEQIKKRDLGNLFTYEQQTQNKQTLLEVIRRKDGPTCEDKLRLFLVHFISADVSRGDMVEYESCLREAGCDMKALEAAKKIKSFHKMAQMTVSGQVAAASSAKTPSSSDFLGKLTGLKDAGGGIGGVLGNLVSGVRNLLPESVDTPITKQIDNTLEAITGVSTGLRATLGASSPKDDTMVIHDPKSSRIADKKHAPSTPQKSAYNHLIVFVVGGSNYIEYNHVMEYINSKQLRLQVTFGSTDLLTGSEFLSQLSLSM